MSRNACSYEAAAEGNISANVSMMLLSVSESTNPPLLKRLQFGANQFKISYSHSTGG